MPHVLVNGKLYEWTLTIGTNEFQQFARVGDPDEFDVLRITSSDSGFDIAIRLLSGQYSDGIRKSLGPVLVLGHRFPDERRPVETGILIELRPKLRSLESDEPNSATVERIVQWCSSSHFKAVRVNSSGGHWVGYGRNDNA